MKGSDWGRAVRGYIALSLVWLAILGAALLITRRPSPRAIEILPPPTAAPTATPLPSATPAPLHVDIAGAVVAPGVYRLPPGSIVADAIAAAGGPAENAELDRINKAVSLQDGMQIYVPSRSQPEPPPLVNPIPPGTATASAQPAAGPTELTDINTATAEALEALPGIGPATAQKIIEGRPYGTPTDLLRVKGIGPATFEKLKDLVTVR